LIPFLNMLFLSFAPVGAALYYLDKNRDWFYGNPKGW
jgi:hypothetical protein